VLHVHDAAHQPQPPRAVQSSQDQLSLQGSLPPQPSEVQIQSPHDPLDGPL